MKPVQTGLFDLEERYEQLSASGDPLIKLEQVMSWERFRPILKRAFSKQRKSNAGRPPYDYVMMFKVLVLQSLYNLSDHQIEFQIRDRLSFMRFLGLSVSHQIPDEKTVWNFREQLIRAKAINKLFKKFDHYLTVKGYDAQCGTIVDAAIVETPKQRNNRNDNAEIKKGKTPKKFKENPAKLRQKDVDARWTIKRGQTYYGYKNHINIDTKHKLVRCYHVTSANTCDSNCLKELLSPGNNDERLWADSIYRTPANEKLLEAEGYLERMHYRPRAGSGGQLPEPLERENRRRSKIRKRVEHIFGFIENSMHGAFIKTIGIKRARWKIGMMNLVYNMCRYEQLNRLGVT
jgi:IS5 family transposase